MVREYIRPLHNSKTTTSVKFTDKQTKINYKITLFSNQIRMQNER